MYKIIQSRSFNLSLCLFPAYGPQKAQHEAKRNVAKKRCDTTKGKLCTYASYFTFVICVQVNSRTSLCDIFICCRRCSKLSRAAVAIAAGADICQSAKVKSDAAAAAAAAAADRKINLCDCIVCRAALFLVPSATNSNFDIIFTFFASFLSFCLWRIFTLELTSSGQPATPASPPSPAPCLCLHLRLRPWELHLALIYQPAA